MENTFKDLIEIKLKKMQGLRYGENPHQEAALYREEEAENLPYIVNAQQLAGKDLSFNNILDLDSALLCAAEFDLPTAVIVKHNNPCGVACSEKLKNAYILSYNCDPLSAFGGIIGLNKKVDEETARTIFNSGFLEAIIAPSYEEAALNILKNKKDFRIMELNYNWKILSQKKYLDMKRISGGILYQERDTHIITTSDLKVVTKKAPTDEEIKSLLFAFSVCKNVKSNTIILTQNTRTIGIGAGQMSRVDSTYLAIKKARLVKDINPHLPIVLASDAFFPKVDAVEEAIKFGISAIIQPGGSIADREVIDICDQNNISMVFTGIRHFRH